MSRKLVSLVATLALAAAGLLGLTLATTTAAQASVIPVAGSYSGVDHGSRTVSLSFSGNQVSHILVGHQSFGGAHVSNGMWHETCHGGWCTKGQWVTDKHIQGFWRHGGSSHWTPFSVSTRAVSAYVGSYQGSDHSGVSIKLTYSHGMVNNFAVNHHIKGNAHVSGLAFNTCTGGVCFKGHWQDDYTISGSWRHAHESTWRPFEIYAYAH